MLPGLHQLNHGAGDLPTDDAEGKQSTDAQLIAGDQPNAHHHAGDAGELAEEFGEGTDGFTGDLEFEILANKTAVAFLKIPTGF